SAAEMAGQCDIIVMCVTASPQVEANVAEIVTTARPGLIIIDTSTADPASTGRLAAELAERDITLIDAPLSRTPAHAWDGELTTYVGGPPEPIENIRPLLSTWANVIIETGGPVGSAHAIKLINNLIGIGYAAVWSEAYAMVEAAGLDTRVLHEIVSNSGLNCGNFQSYSKYILEGDPNAHKFALVNCLKDITYYNRLAAQHNAATLVSDGVLQTLKLGKNMGYGERYMTQMADIFRHLNAPNT
ncbi:MAG: NAD(P)-dependent oxidoreductase, partial [Aestuariivirgaceae bacterium]